MIEPVDRAGHACFSSSMSSQLSRMRSQDRSNRRETVSHANFLNYVVCDRISPAPKKNCAVHLRGLLVSLSQFFT